MTLFDAGMVLLLCFGAWISGLSLGYWLRNEEQ